MHQNSLFANNAGREIGSFSKRCQSILDLHRRMNMPMTDRMVKEYLGFEDMNAVRPRINELIDAGMLEENGSMKDPATGMRVRLVQLKKQSFEYPD